MGELNFALQLEPEPLGPVPVACRQRDRGSGFFFFFSWSQPLILVKEISTPAHLFKFLGSVCSCGGTGHTVMVDT